MNRPVDPDPADPAVRSARCLVEETAAALLREADITGAVRRLPLSSQDVVVALGDSITHDGCSWAEILRVVLARTSGATVVNAGVSGDTTSQAIARTGVVAGHRPTWVIQLLGTNDARRHGRLAQARTVSLGETIRNCARLGRIVTQDLRARLLRLTPPPVLEARAVAWTPLADAQISWRAADVAAIARELVVFDPGTVDLHGALRDDRLGAWLHPDGVHPTFLGQQQILRVLLTEWPDRTAAR